MQTRQNKAVRIITNAKYNDPALPLFKSLKITPIEQLYKIHLAKFMYQHQCKLLPKPLQSLYKSNEETHEHNTRHRQDPHITARRTQQISTTFLHRAPEFWYTIPEQIKEARSIQSFKNRITKLLGY